MMHVASLTVAKQATLGQHGTTFEDVLGFVAQLSMVLWSLVILTTIIRFIGIQKYRRNAIRTTGAETPTQSATVTAPHQLSDSGLARLGLIEVDTAEAEAKPSSAEHSYVLTREPIRNATFDEIRPPSQTRTTAPTFKKAQHRTPDERRTESRPPALAGNSTRN